MDTTQCLQLAREAGNTAIELQLVSQQFLLARQSTEDDQCSFHPAAVSLKEYSFHGLSPGASCPEIPILKGTLDFLGNAEQVNMMNKREPNTCWPVFLPRRKTCLTFTIKMPFQKLSEKRSSSIELLMSILKHPGLARGGREDVPAQYRGDLPITGQLFCLAWTATCWEASTTHGASHPASITSNTKPSEPWAGHCRAHQPAAVVVHAHPPPNRVLSI